VDSYLLIAVVLLMVLAAALLLLRGKPSSGQVPPTVRSPGAPRSPEPPAAEPVVVAEPRVATSKPPAPALEPAPGPVTEPQARGEPEAPHTTPAPPPDVSADEPEPTRAKSSDSEQPPASGPEETDVDTGPQKLILVTAVGMTDPGLRRKHNEDAYACLEDHNLFAIADGMGLHAAGEVASKLTIEAITEAYEKGQPEPHRSPRGTRAKRLVGVIERANQIVFEMANEVEAYSGMGTTVVIAHFSPSKQRVHIAHVGDSRCYRLRAGEIKQLTVDHTLGSVGIVGKTSAILSRAVGIEENVEVDLTTVTCEVGDIYLLCSDGLSRMTTDDKILQTVRSHSDLDDASRALITLANEGGGRDNVTTILIRVDPGKDPSLGPPPA
jgi:protein phosphatase